MQFASPSQQSKRHGFTLVEVVMTLIIGAMLLTTASFYLYSILNVYERTRKNPSFDEHVQNVTLFLSHAFLETQDTHYIFENTPETQTPPSSNAPNSNQATPKPNQETAQPSEFPTVAWKHLPGDSDYDIYHLSFTFYTPNPLIQLSNYPNYPTIAYLQLIPGEGLYLIWHISKTYYKDEPLPVYRTLLSPYAQQLTYLSFSKDTSEWSSTTENPDSEEGAKGSPKILRITFSDGSNSEVGTVLINNELSMEGFL